MPEDIKTRTLKILEYTFQGPLILAFILEHVLKTRMQKTMTAELGYSSTWDELLTRPTSLSQGATTPPLPTVRHFQYLLDRIIVEVAKIDPLEQYPVSKTDCLTHKPMICT